MSRINHADEQQQSGRADFEEVTQLCHEYSSERDFHKLGFQCLLKKLKEIEKIILAISKMSNNEALQMQETPVSSFRDVIPKATNSTSHQDAPAEDINLPNNLTLHSKQVLREIFQTFEINMNEVSGKLKVKFLETLNGSYCAMETVVNAYSEWQKTETKKFIEGLLSECFEQNVFPRGRHVKTNPHAPNIGFELLNLPEDLSPFTKSVLNEIFTNYEANAISFAEEVKKQIYELLIAAYGKFEAKVNTMAEMRRTQLRHEMEGIFTDQNGGQPLDSVPEVEGKVQASNNECGFDAQLARHLHELSRVVQVILDKKDNAEVTIDENRLSVVNKKEGPEIDDVPNRAPANTVIDRNANTCQNDPDETEYKGVPEFKKEKKRIVRLP